MCVSINTNKTRQTNLLERAVFDMHLKKNYNNVGAT